MKAKWENFTEKEIQELINSCQSKKELCLKLGYLNYSSKIIQGILNNMPNIDLSPIEKYSANNLIGQQFGLLTVINKTDKRDSQGNIIWECKCSCGNPKSVYVPTASLKRKHNTSCGCHGAGYLVGKKFGHLTVIAKSDSKTNGLKRQWLCECDCAARNKVLVTTDHLKSGHTVSCGCIKSKGEEIIARILKSAELQYKTQVSFKDLKGNKGSLFFDFGVYENDKILYLIEFQGIQHYQAVDIFGGEEQFQLQCKYDSLKEEYCKKNKIPLIKIPYYDINKINIEYLNKRVNIQ